MGMDVVGRNPSSKTGEYIGFSVWNWRPIHAICNTAIEADKLPFVTQKWQWNYGAGLRTQKQCDRLVTALEKLLPQLPDPYYWHFDPEAIEKSTGGRLTVDFLLNFQYAYSIRKRDLQAFIDFLKHCGGFKIY